MMNSYVKMVFAVIFFTSCIGRSSETHDVAITPPLPSATVEVEALKIDFEIGDSGRGVTREGTRFSFNSYRSTDGTGITTNLYSHVSPEQAVENFKKVVRDAEEVLENRKDSGKSNCHRAVIRVREKETDSTFFEVILLEGDKVHKISSRSLSWAVEFEKWYRKHWGSSCSRKPYIEMKGE